MTEAYIIDAVRTPVGRAAGSARCTRPTSGRSHQDDRRAQRPRPDGGRGRVVRLRRRDRSAGRRHPRTCWLAAGLPEEIPGTTIDRQCGSSQQAVHFAAQAVMSGTQRRDRRRRRAEHEHDPDLRGDDVAEQYGFTDPFSGSRAGRPLRAEGGPVRGAEMIAEKWDVTREDMGSSRSSRTSGAPGPAEGRFDPRSFRSGEGDSAMKDRVKPNGGEDPVAEAARRGRPAHRCVS